MMLRQLNYFIDPEKCCNGECCKNWLRNKQKNNDDEWWDVDNVSMTS